MFTVTYKMTFVAGSTLEGLTRVQKLNAPTMAVAQKYAKAAANHKPKPEGFFGASSCYTVSDVHISRA